MKFGIDLNRPITHADVFPANSKARKVLMFGMFVALFGLVVTVLASSFSLFKYGMVGPDKESLTETILGFGFNIFIVGGVFIFFFAIACSVFKKRT